MLTSLGLYLKIGLGVALLLVVSFVYWDINHLKYQLETVKVANTELTVSNKTLATAIENLKIQQQQIIHEFELARAADAVYEKRLAELENYNSPRKRAQITTARSKNPDQLIVLMNKNSECYRLNFGKSGKCVNGTWHPQ